MERCLLRITVVQISFSPADLDSIRRVQSGCHRPPRTLGRPVESGSTTLNARGLSEAAAGHNLDSIRRPMGPAFRWATSLQWNQ
jgi:hypothetical protein